MDIDDKNLAFNDPAEASGGFVSTAVSDSQSSDNHDEVQEIRNRSRTEDRRVNLWRWTLLFLILAVGVVITVLTYYFLLQEELRALNIGVSTLLVPTTVYQ
mmetsp:Transcript_18821/g.46629  ORF Transcript_18821/g.46629 Transcript_18821/m.46629 type:complete len:101 (+) Transcript_18821:609-911(+)